MGNGRRNVERIRQDMRGQGGENYSYKGFRKEMRQGRNEVIWDKGYGERMKEWWMKNEKWKNEKCLFSNTQEFYIMFW